MSTPIPEGEQKKDTEKRHKKTREDRQADRKSEEEKRSREVGRQFKSSTEYKRI
jgi:hypothetical protein